MHHEQNQIYGKTISLLLPSNVRWGTHHRLLSAVIETRDAFLLMLNNNSIRNNRDLRDEATRLRDEMNDRETRYKMYELEAVMKPITTATKHIEGDVVNQSDAYSRVMDSISLAEYEVDHMYHFNDEVGDQIRGVSAPQVCETIFFLDFARSKRIWRSSHLPCNQLI